MNTAGSTANLQRRILLACRTGFYRRPCFWWALAVIAGILAADAWHLEFSPLPLLASGTLLLTVVAAGRQFWAASPVFFFLLAAVWGFRSLTAGLDPALQPGRAVTIAGVVVRVLSEDAEGARAILQVERRHSPAGWVPLGGRVGLAAPVSVREGDQVQASGVLKEILPATNPGGFDARRYWQVRGVRVRLDPHERGFRRLGYRKGPPWTEMARRLREHVSAFNRATLQADAAAIANRFLIGTDPGGDPERATVLEETFRRSGTIHLLVVSGTQVGLVLGPFLWLSRRLWLFRVLFWTLGVGVLFLFYLTTSGDASILRASVLGLTVILGRAFLRQTDGENCLGIAALAMLAANPFAVFDIGAQLSFAAVWGLVRLAPALERTLVGEGGGGVEGGGGRREGGSSVHPAWRALATAVSVTVAAHLATAPVLAYHFQTSCWSALLANLCVVPPATFLLWATIFHAAAGFLDISYLAPVVGFLAHAVLGYARFFSQAPFGAAPVFPVAGWGFPLLGGVALFTATSLRHYGRWCGVAGLVALLLAFEHTPAPPPARPTVRAIDVGQGDAVLIQGSGGSNVLVDAGPPPLGSGPTPLARTLRALRIGSLDAILVSHAHADHIGGLPVLLGEVPVRALIYSPRVQVTPLWQEALAVADRFRVRKLPASAGDRIELGDAQLVVLAPEPGDAPGEENPNEESLVAHWEAGGSRVLLMGDSGEPTEAGLVEAGADLRADLLKVGHHGSQGATSTLFLEAVRPAGALISCGRGNVYGHPHGAALERLAAARIPVTRTDQCGMVTVTLGTDGLEVSTFLRR